MPTQINPPTGVGSTSDVFSTMNTGNAGQSRRIGNSRPGRSYYRRIRATLLPVFYAVYVDEEPDVISIGVGRIITNGGAGVAVDTQIGYRIFDTAISLDGIVSTAPQDNPVWVSPAEQSATVYWAKPLNFVIGFYGVPTIVGTMDIEFTVRTVYN